jgi:hypothetical protein
MAFSILCAPANQRRRTKGPSGNLFDSQVCGMRTDVGARRFDKFCPVLWAQAPGVSLLAWSAPPAHHPRVRISVGRKQVVGSVSCPEQDIPYLRLPRLP